MAHLPYLKTFEQVDFNFQPSIDERQIRELRTLRFVHEASNVILLGPPGVGKTHLAVALAEATIRAGEAAYFMTAHDLVDNLGRAYREGRLECRMKVYLAPKVLIIDEMGYLPLVDYSADDGREGASAHQSSPCCGRPREIAVTGDPGGLVVDRHCPGCSAQSGIDAQLDNRCGQQFRFIVNIVAAALPALGLREILPCAPP